MKNKIYSLNEKIIDGEKIDVKQCWILEISDNSDYLRPEYTQWNSLKEAVNYAYKYKDENYTLEFAKIDNKYNDDYIEIFGWLDDDLHYNDVEKEICFKVASENIKYFV